MRDIVISILQVINFLLYFKFLNRFRSSAGAILYDHFVTATHLAELMAPDNATPYEKMLLQI
jgi:hypothetical protein